MDILNHMPQELRIIMENLPPAAVAFSGGIDSTLVAFLCNSLHEEETPVLIADSPFLPRSELQAARNLAEALHFRLIVVPFDVRSAEEILANPPDRCYHCKKHLLKLLQATAASLGIHLLLEGSNADDQEDYRPGMKAVRELGVRSPLLEAGVTKAEIRRLAKFADIPIWNKPSSACLASRIPSHHIITMEALSHIEKAEDYLKALGFRQCRVRTLHNTARIEVHPGEIPRFFDTEFLRSITIEFERIGFDHTSLDLEGYKTGKANMTESLLQEGS